MKIKSLLNKVVSFSGYQLSKRKTNARNSADGVIKNIASHFSPDSIIDVGAALGSWTEKCHIFFPQAKYVLIEPLAEFSSALKKIQEKRKNVYIVQAAATATPGKKIFNVHADLFGSSLNKEAEGGNVDGTPREVEAKTIDQIAAENNLSGKFFIKLDVQGAELEALSGAKKILADTECLIIEASLFKSFINGDDLATVVEKMKEFGFVVYDIFGGLYRPYDDALCQIDLVFVKENGIFREFQGYASPEQRKKQDEKFKQELNKKIK